MKETDKFPGFSHIAGKTRPTPFGGVFVTSPGIILGNWEGKGTNLPDLSRLFLER